MPSPPIRRTIPTTLHLTADHLATLDALAERSERSRSWIVRNLIERAAVADVPTVVPLRPKAQTADEFRAGAATRQVAPTDAKPNKSVEPSGAAHVHKFAPMASGLVVCQCGELKK